MKQFSTPRILGFAAGLLATSGSLFGQAITENFDDITLLAGNGWSLQNLSTPVGSTNWFQGNNIAAGGPFDSYNGAANAYIGANYNNTGNTGTISNWMIMPTRTLRNGDVITFYTRKVAPDAYADRLEVRLSTNGASANAGTNATTVGDFTTTLLAINPSLVLGVYPTVWTQYTITISGLSAPTSGRVAFRYHVTGAGFSGTNSDYIGIDAFQYTPYVCPTVTVTPSSVSNGVAGTAYSETLSNTGTLGGTSY
ncbi:MAG TPA: choice-of-anchor J domain-containing protein, partial [Bacteroidia bacterium]|nr:choice-of-anchor J domain-containing protein [Bacteroidia bacterium]